MVPYKHVSQVGFEPQLIDETSYEVNALPTNESRVHPRATKQSRTKVWNTSPLTWSQNRKQFRRKADEKIEIIIVCKFFYVKVKPYNKMLLHYES